jgi:predicted aspartyl protease
LPQSLITALGLAWLCRQHGQLADGSIQAFDVYVAVVEWGSQLRTVEVDAADAQPLIGMALMEGSELRVQVMSGGSATITSLPDDISSGQQ